MNWPKDSCLQEIKASGAQTWPRSCPRCGLGKCTNEEIKMSFNIISKATISVFQIEQLLKKAIEEETGRKVERIEFKITTQCDFRDQPYGHSVTSAEVVFEEPK